MDASAKAQHNQFETIRVLGSIRDEVTLAIHKELGGWEHITQEMLEDTKAIVYRILCTKVGECLLDEFDINSSNSHLNVRLMCAEHQLPFSIHISLYPLMTGAYKQTVGPFDQNKAEELAKISIRDTFFPKPTDDDDLKKDNVTVDPNEEKKKEQLKKDYDRAMKIVE